MRQLIHAGQLQGHTVAVMGTGASGLAAMKLLRALGATVRLLDRKDPGEEIRAQAAALDVQLIVGEHAPEHFAGLDLLVVSPGVPVLKLGHVLGHLPQEKIVSELELASWFVTEPMLAVTGTSGKTTTVSLIGHMLRTAGREVFVGGNIGTPLSEYLLSDQQADVLVLEVSSFQLQNCHSFHPHVAVLLNVRPNHLDFHATMEEYLGAKLKLFARQTDKDLAVAPLELRDELEARNFTKGKRVYFVPTARFADSKLIGKHNQANTEAAWLAARAFGVDEATAASAVASFEPLPHRLTPVAEKNGVLFVDDSKATTLDAMAAAVQAFDRPVRLLAGGVFKGGEPAALLPVFQGRVKSVGLFGASREVFESAWAGHVPLSWDATLEDAVRRLFAQAQPGEVILLSPATASFDLYSGYKARGDDFIRVARSL